MHRLARSQVASRSAGGTPLPLRWQNSHVDCCGWKDKATAYNAYKVLKLRLHLAHFHFLNFSRLHLVALRYLVGHLQIRYCIAQTQAIPIERAYKRDFDLSSFPFYSRASTSSPSALSQHTTLTYFTALPLTHTSCDALTRPSSIHTRSFRAAHPTAHATPYSQSFGVS